MYLTLKFVKFAVSESVNFAFFLNSFKSYTIIFIHLL
nr:MAG TPA: hypothetical protein [Caudoviricetes sp.]